MAIRQIDRYPKLFFLLCSLHTFMRELCECWLYASDSDEGFQCGKPAVGGDPVDGRPLCAYHYDYAVAFENTADDDLVECPKCEIYGPPGFACDCEGV